MADRLYTSSDADEVLTSLRLETSLEKANLARIAFTLSLAKKGAQVPKSWNMSGAEIRRTSFMSEDESFIRMLIAHVYQKSDFSEEEFYSSKSIVKDHIDSGCLLLSELFPQGEITYEAFLKKLVNEIDKGAGKGERAGSRINLFIGKTVLKQEKQFIELNNTARHANSHLAIMGKPGVGKTQFLLKILADIRQQSGFQTHFIYFDYKGDVVQNRSFIDASKAQPFRLLQDGESLPINPFILPSYDDQSISLSAREKAESFASIQSKIGSVQKGTLVNVIRSAYQKRADSNLPYPDFHDVLEIAKSAYEEEGKKEDTLIEILKDLAEFNLFWNHGNETPPIESLFNRTLLIDVHAMPVLKELVAYLVIERLYKEMSAMPDSPVKNGIRTLRTLLVIDEAHNYLSQKNVFLQRIIREGRSKGIAVFFASQSPADYQQKFFNFQELLEFTFIFQCDGVAAPAVQDILGCTSKTAKDLQTEIARLEPWQVIARSSEKTEDFIKFTAEPFYKHFR